MFSSNINKVSDLIRSPSVGLDLINNTGAPDSFSYRFKMLLLAEQLRKIIKFKVFPECTTLPHLFAAHMETIKVKSLKKKKINKREIRLNGRK